MKRILITLVVLSLALSMSAFATDTRVLTLGENNTVLLDENNIWLFPSRINDYPNLAVGEFGFGNGDADMTRLGIHWKFDRDNPWVIGTYFENLPAYVPQALMPDMGELIDDDLVAPDFALLDNRRIHLFYGRALGGANFGMRLSWLNSSREDDDQTEAKEAMNFLDLDFGLTSPTGQWDVALNLGLGSWTHENDAAQTITDNDGFFDMSLMGRYFYQVNPNYTLIPHAGFMYKKRGVEYYQLAGGTADDVDLNTQDKSTMFDLGCGVNYTPATNVLAVADFGFMYSKANRENDPSVDYTGNPIEERDVTEYALPYFKIGLDADVFKWLDVRFGAVSYWTGLTDETKGDVAPSKEIRKFADNDTYLGFGFHWGRLHVDTYTDPAMFLDGFNFLSGSENSMNFQISAVYEMM